MRLGDSCLNMLLRQGKQQGVGQWGLGVRPSEARVETSRMALTLLTLHVLTIAVGGLWGRGCISHG